MSDVTQDTQTIDTPNADAQKAPKRTRKPVMEHSAAIVAYAKCKNLDEVRAGKQFRAKLRANGATYVKNGGRPHVKNTPWPAHPRKALAAIMPDVPAFKS